MTVACRCALSTFRQPLTHQAFLSTPLRVLFGPHASRITHYISRITYHALHIAYHVSRTMYFISRITYRISCIMYHVLRVMCVSCVMPGTSIFTGSGDAARKYQREINAGQVGFVLHRHITAKTQTASETNRER